ncbi:MAG: 50S ribosome-binding GTPase [Firmicutes bacterium]|nr:50S ribosome-binding GTPase [Bacillota bacterium]
MTTPWRCVIAGRTNVGKTRFALGLARLMTGEELIVVHFDLPSGHRYTKSFGFSQAVEDLAGRNPYRTRCLQSVEIPVSKGRDGLRIELVDSPGLSRGIHEDPGVRQGMCQALNALRTADMVVHVVDAHLAEVSGGLTEEDRQILEFGRSHGAYLLVANKMDLMGGRAGHKRLIEEFSGCPVVAVSCVSGTGLKKAGKVLCSRFGRSGVSRWRVSRWR